MKVLKAEFSSDPEFVERFTAYAKNERADLSQQDRNDFRQLTALLVGRFKRRKS